MNLEKIGNWKRAKARLEGNISVLEHNLDLIWKCWRAQCIGKYCNFEAPLKDYELCAEVQTTSTYIAIRCPKCGHLQGKISATTKYGINNFKGEILKDALFASMNPRK